MTSHEQPSHPAIAWRRAIRNAPIGPSPAQHRKAVTQAKKSGEPLPLLSVEFLDSNTKLVAYTLAEYVDSAGRAFPGSERLAASAGLHRETVKASMRRLEEAGWLAVIERGGTAGGPRASVVQVTLPAFTGSPELPVTTLTGSPEHPVRPATGSPELPVAVATGSPEQSTGSPEHLTGSSGLPQQEEQEEQEQQQRAPDHRARQLEVATELGRRAALRRSADNPAGYAAVTARKILADSGQLAAIDAAIAAHPEAPTSSVADAVEAPPPPSAPGRRPEYRSEPACATCEDRGVLDVDPTKNLATRCPDCSIQAAVVA